MPYADITFRDKNRIKRWIQKKRLLSAIELCDQLTSPPKTICDFGAGNGEFCKLLAKKYPGASIICYEPTANFLSEARQNLRYVSKIEFCQDIQSINSDTLDAVFCLEVFEHLPPKETIDALQAISDKLKRKAKLIVGVPVGVGVPALYKGIFRMFRRFGAFDANVKNVALSFLLHPPSQRPTSEITPGFRYHFEHMGFDFRPFQAILDNYFKVKNVSASPFAMLGSLFMPEVYFVAENDKDDLIV